ncbi:AvrD family protein [Wenjunlia tyrosinilytica]|jgi:hypothetical protein|uniref:Avirulence D protein (AvrD) n=1 Tax=Wenjunlia tyrosinilytica TaxID=1544741 RepID=A0A917ZPB6_9ACTN|nr:AvrD family protein [Wenjunlia tyrosinilytica]GGO88648.1 hypothetical protein GCM10012280_29970 [Wenjunlia tyrosinilytica]
MTTGQRLALRSIDDYLGPGETRFFSRGYQRATYDVHDIVVTPAGSEKPGVLAKANLTYPADWSKKKDGTDLRPHLSTIDALVLGVQLAELHLVHAYGLDGQDRRTMRLRKIVLRAGNAPQEDLEGIALSAKLVDTAPEPAAAGGFQSVYDCSVGGLRVRCEIEHRVAGKAGTEARFGSLVEALGPGEERFYGEGFKLRRHTIGDVRVDMDDLTARGQVAFHEVEGSRAPTRGIEGEGQPSIALVDCFVVNLQLAQVLMYELDSITRESSNTLWMMQTVMDAAEIRQPLTAPLEAHASISAKRLLPLRGATWRSVDIQGRLGGIEMRCSFAHELPAKAEPEAA